MGNKNSGRRPQPAWLKALRGNPGKRKPKPAEPAEDEVAVPLPLVWPELVEGATAPKRTASYALSVINRLTHTKGPFALERFRLRPWQTQILRHLFRKRKGGLRQY